MENVIYNVALTGLMAEKIRSEKEILLVIIWQEVLERKRYEMQIRTTNNREVKAILEALRRTEDEHKQEAVKKLAAIEPGFVLDENEFPGGKISGVLLLDEKEFHYEEKLLDMNTAKDVLHLISIIDTDVKKEAYVARLYASLSADTKDAGIRKMLNGFVDDEKVHMEKLKQLGEKIKLLHGPLLDQGGR